MKTVKRLILVLAFVTTAFASHTASAQQATPQTVNNRTYSDDDNDHNISPWWGLLGLLGLFGLMRKTDRNYVETNPRTPR
jgi:hypothetical protein